MTLEIASPWGRTLGLQNKASPEFSGGISSMRKSWVEIFPSPFDTMSLPEVGVSIKENSVVVSLPTELELSAVNWFNQTISEIVQLLWLPKEWNSDNPKKITAKVIERMLAILLAILDPDSIAPAVVPTTRGGVQVEWHINGIDFEIEAFDMNKLEYFFSGPNGDKEGIIEDNPDALKQFTSWLKINK